MTALSLDATRVPLLPLCIALDVPRSTVFPNDH